MPESLAIKYDALRREIGRFLGLSRDPANWTADQTQDVADILKSGLRYFYWPRMGEERHVWSFLRPLATLAVAADTRAYDLPDDFGGAISSLAFAETTGERQLQEATPDELRTLYAAADRSGKPKYYAVRTKAGTFGTESRYELLVYPVPDAAYTLSYRYSLNPPTLSDENPYHLGGPQHSETVLESCLAAAEKTMAGEEQIHAKRFQECLAASLSLDRQQFGM